MEVWILPLDPGFARRAAAMPLCHAASHLAKFGLAGGERKRGRQTCNEQRKRRHDRAPRGQLFERVRLHHDTHWCMYQDISRVV